MKIVLIGPGIMPIPPENWGAVESLIWDQCEYLKEKGHHVDIINTKDLSAVADYLNNNHYDFIHLQYDDHAQALNQLLKKPFCVTTHYGYVKEHYPHYPGWKPIFDSVMQSPGIISLSPEIEILFKRAGYNKFSRVLRNGARFKDFISRDSGNGKSLCLGKVEPRKKQTYLARIGEGRCNIDFIGPIIDPFFRPNSTCSYNGVWSKQDLYNNLSSYSSLILLSDGEAAPLVVTEALCAGLSLVLTETAAANLKKDLPFIKILSSNYTPEEAVDAINQVNSENNNHRQNIKQYAKENFDWAVVCDDYVKIAQEFINENSLSNNSNQ